MLSSFPKTGLPAFFIPICFHLSPSASDRSLHLVSQNICIDTERPQYCLVHSCRYMVYHEVTKGIPQQLQLLKLPLGLRKHQEGAIPDASAAPRWRLFRQLLPLEVPDIVLVGKHHSWRLGQLPMFTDLGMAHFFSGMYTDSTR